MQNGKDQRLPCIKQNYSAITFFLVTADINHGMTASHREGFSVGITDTTTSETRQPARTCSGCEREKAAAAAVSAFGIAAIKYGHLAAKCTHTTLILPAAGAASQGKR